MGTVKKVINWTVNDWKFQEKLVSTMDICIPLIKTAVSALSLSNRHRLSKKHHKNKGIDLSSIVNGEQPTGAKKTNQEDEITNEKTEEYLKFEDNG